MANIMRDDFDDFGNYHGDHTPQALTDAIMPAAQLAMYTTAMTNALAAGRMMVIIAYWRDRSHGALVPAGIPARWKGVVHSLQPHDNILNAAGNGPRMDLHVAYEEAQQDANIIINHFPNQDADYFAVEIQPTQSADRGKPAPLGINLAPNPLAVVAAQAAQAAAILVAEENADAAHLRERRHQIVIGLKVPYLINDKHHIFYPHQHLAHPDPAAAFKTVMDIYWQDYLVAINNPTKHQERLDTKAAIIAFYAQPPPIRTTKAHWLPVFLLCAKLASLHAFSLGGHAAEAACSAAFTLGWDEGYVSWTEIFKASAKRDREPDNKGPENFGERLFDSMKHSGFVPPPSFRGGARGGYQGKNFQQDFRGGRGGRGGRGF